MVSRARSRCAATRRRAFPGAALLLLLPVLLGAAPGREDPVALLEAADGDLTRRDLAELSAELLGREGAVLIRFEGLDPLPISADAGPLAEITLAGGNRLFGRPVGGRGEELEIELVGRISLALRIDDLRSLEFPDRIPAGEAAEPAPEGDRLLWVRRGAVDRVDGTVEELTPEGVRFDSLLGSRLFPWDELAALFVAPLEEEPEGEAVEGLPVAVDLIDGGRLRGRLQALSRAGCLLEVGGSAPVGLPLEAISEIALDDGSIAFLSDLPPSRAEEGSPFGDDMGMTWPHRMDRSVTGTPLVAGGRSWTRGIGVHAPSRLGWELDGRWRSLRGSAAVDDQVLQLPARGSVVFRILVDGEERWASRVLRGGQAPVPIPAVDLAGARELVLEVDMADDFHVADRADWLRVLVLR